MSWLRGVTFPLSEEEYICTSMHVWAPDSQQVDRCIIDDEDVFVVQTKQILRLLSYSYVCLPQHPY